MKNQTTRSVLGTCLVLLITFCLSFIMSKKAESLPWMDVTSNSRYTLSEGTKAILDKLQIHLTIKFFYSKKAADQTGMYELQKFNAASFYTRDLVRSYERKSTGKVKVEEYDPRAYTNQESDADQLGIRRIPLSMKGDKAFYFGLAVTSDTGAKEVIEFINPTDIGSLEYKISEMIDRVSRPKKSKVGVISGLEVVGEELSPQMQQMRRLQGRSAGQDWMIIQQIKQTYEVENLTMDVDKISEDIAYLLVIHPKGISDKTLYAIDQFVMRGGKAMIFVDPFCLNDQPPRDPRNPMAAMSYQYASGINKLLEPWGLKMEPQKFLGDLELIGGLNMGRGMQSFIGVTDYKASKGCFNESEIITQNLETAGTYIAGALSKTDVEGVEVTPLITTTEKGNTWTASSFEIMSPMGMDASGMTNKFKPGASKIWVAAKITGTLKSVFPEGYKDPFAEEEPEEEKPKEDEKEDEKEGEKEGEEQDPEEPEEPEQLKQSKEPTVVIVVADVDMISNFGGYTPGFFGMQVRNHNPSFVLNALEYLGGSSDLIGIRSRGQTRREFTRIKEIERKAEERTRAKVETIRAEIQAFETELNQLQDKATEKNIGLLQSEAIKKEREKQALLTAKRRELREVQRVALEDVEAIQSLAGMINYFYIPALVLLIGICLAIVRFSRRRTQMIGDAA